MHTRQRRALFALGCFFVMGGLGMTVSGDNSRDKQVHALISQHASGNQGRMNDAIRKLNGFGEGAVPALIDALADEDASVRRNAAWALGRMGEPAKAAAPILIEMLTDEDASVRARAVGALRQMGEPAVHVLIDALLEALADEDGSVRAEAARVLGTLGEPAKAAVPALIEAGHDEVGSVSRSARAALRKIGTPEAVKAVEQFGAREKLALQLLRFGIPLGVVLFPLLVLFLAVYALKRYRRSRPEV